MKRVVLLSALVLLVVAGSLRADSPKGGELSASDLRAAIFAPAEPAQASLPVSGAMQFKAAATTCSATAVCTNGVRVSCTGTTCESEPRCFVRCDGHLSLCTSPCP